MIVRRLDMSWATDMVLGIIVSESRRRKVVRWTQRTSMARYNQIYSVCSMYMCLVYISRKVPHPNISDSLPRIAIINIIEHPFVAFQLKFYSITIIYSVAHTPFHKTNNSHIQALTITKQHPWQTDKMQMRMLRGRQMTWSGKMENGIKWIWSDLSYKSMFYRIHFIRLQLRSLTIHHLSRINRWFDDDNNNKSPSWKR